MNGTGGISDRVLGRGIQAVGCLLLLFGLPLWLCGGWPWLWWTLEGGWGWPGWGLLWFVVSLASVGGGAGMWLHARRALRGQPSDPLRLPPLWVLGWGLVLCLAVGEVIGRGQALPGSFFFPAVFVLAAGLPPLMALAWAVDSLPPGADPCTQGLTWRQASLALIGGGTLAVGLAVALEILVPGMVLALVAGLFQVAQAAWERLLDEWVGGQVAQALGSYGFVLTLVELAVIAPLVEEFVKPLPAWPLLRRAQSPRQAFLIGAAAGAGFAILENLLYAGLGIRAWGGVVVVRALGAAVHPLGSGLVALGWYEAGQETAPPGQVRRWLSRFGLAVGLHGLWNGGIVLLVALAGASFFGPEPAQVTFLGLTEFGVLLALLGSLGAAAWIGLRVAIRRLGPARPDLAPRGAPSERLMAIWAVLCLAVSLVVGLSALRVLGGGR